MILVFSNPSILWALLALPVLAVLMMVLPRAMRIRVSSLSFWIDPQEQAAIQRARRFRRLDLASLLLIGALAFLILALASPAVVQRERQGVALTIIVDRSASLAMPADDDSGRQRAELLRQRLDEFLAGLPGDMPLDVQMLPARGGLDSQPAPAGSELLINRLDGTNGSSIPAEVRRWLERHFRPVDLALEPVRLRQAAQAARDRSNAPVLLVTDVSPYAGDGRGAPSGIWLLTSGGNSRNVALTRAVVRQREETYFALVEYTRCGDWQGRPLSGQTLTVSDAGGSPVAAAVVVDLSAESGAITFALADAVARAEGLRVSLEIDDDLAADNSLELSRVDVRRSRIGYVGRADENLHRLLLLTGADVLTAEQAEDLPADLDVTFFVDRRPPPTFRGAAVIINPDEPVGPVVPGGYQPTAAGLRPAAGGELRNLLPEELGRVDRWRAATLGAGVQVVLEDSLSGQPVVVRYLTPGGVVLVVLADLQSAFTDWPSRPSYAVFWSLVVGELSPRAPRRLEFRPADAAALAASRIDGSRCRGLAIDETASVREASAAAERQVRPTVFELWPLVLLAALLAVGLRLWVLR